jgi:hypothetical protein
MDDHPFGKHLQFAIESGHLVGWFTHKKWW